MKGSLAQVKTKIMLDSGALTVNAVSRKFFEINKSKFNKFSEPIAFTSGLQSADGSIIKFSDKRLFTIEIAKRKWEDEFYIIDKLPFEVLLGGKSMQTQGIDLINSQNAVSCLNNKGQRVLIKYSGIDKNKENSPVMSMNVGRFPKIKEDHMVNIQRENSYLSLPDKTYNLRLTEPLVLYPGTETMVPVVASRMPFVKNSQTIMIMSSNSAIDNHSVFTGNGVNLIRNGKTTVAVANLGLKKAEFRKGDLISCCKLVPEDEVITTLDVGNITETTTGKNSRNVNLILAGVTKFSSNEIDEKIPLTSEYVQQQLKKHFLPLDIRIGMSHLNNKQLASLLEVLSKFRDTFALNPDKPGHVSPSVASHDIHTGDAKPINMGPRRVSPAQRKVITDHIKSMLEAGIIEESRSPWAFPVLLVPKPTIDGVEKWRFCIDYRKLNEVTKKEIYALPRIEECINGLSGKMWFTTLDMASGYFQVPMEEKSKEKTAFITYDGQYQFTKMSFGLVNAPSTYQRMMQSVLAGLQWKCLQVYLDDIIIASETFEEHLIDITATLNRLENAGLKMKASKCEFCCSEVKYLGHLISREGIRANPEKIEKVKNWVLPSTSKELEAFIGLAGYYRKLIKAFASREAPLRDAVKAKPFIMDENAVLAFQDLKDALSQNPVLTLPDFSGESKFELHTDASDRGISAILCQLDKKGREQVVQYASRMLTETELKWHTQEKEALAIVWGCQKFRSYLLGAPFDIKTDHKSLQWLWRSEKGKLARWALSMSEFQYTIIHRAGTKNVNADVLSRWPGGKPPEEFEAFPDCAGGVYSLLNVMVEEDSYIRMNENKVKINNEDYIVGLIEMNPQSETRETRGNDLKQQIMNAQKSCDSFLTVIAHLTDNNPEAALETIPSFNTKKFNGYTLIIHEGLLCRIKQDQRKKSLRTKGEAGKEDSVVPINILIPEDSKVLQNKIFTLSHDHPTAAHLGFTKTYAKVELQYFWPTMKTDCHHFCKSCSSCQTLKNATPNTMNRPLKPSLPNHPLERIGIDLIGPLPISMDGNCYALTMVDYFTKMAVAIPLKSKLGVQVADAIFKSWYMVFGIPEQLSSDQGNEFTNDVLARINDRFGVGHKVTSPYYPQSNGLAERFNRTLKTAISAYCEEKPGSWDKYLESITFAYNTSLNAVTSFSPYYLMFGRIPRLPSDVLFSRNFNEIQHDVDQYQIQMTSHLRTAYDIVRKKLYDSAMQSKLRWDANIKGHTSFEKGDEVLVFQPKINSEKGEAEHAHIWKRKWQGPFIIESKAHKDNQDVYVIKDRTTNRVWTMNVHRLIKFIPRKYLKTLPDNIKQITKMVPKRSFLTSLPEDSNEASEKNDVTLDVDTPIGDRSRIVHDEVIADPLDEIIPTGNLTFPQSKDSDVPNSKPHRTAHRHETGETKQEAIRRDKRKQIEDSLNKEDVEMTSYRQKELVVEKIVSHKRLKGNQIKYHTKFEDYPLADIPADWLLKTDFDPDSNGNRPMLQEYWNSVSQNSKEKIPRDFKIKNIIK